MTPHDRKLSFLTLLFSGFIDYAGIAIVYPLFAYILFDPSLHFLPIDTSDSLRGLWLGVLIALSPLLQFFFAPIFGLASDLKGRKKLLRLSFGLALLGYAIAYLACILQNIWLLALYRICVGVSGGNSSIVSAIMADLSTPEKKAKNFGLLNMAFGAGFTLGPFLSGFFAHLFGIAFPFLIAFFLVAFNILLISWKLKETHPGSNHGKIQIFSSFSQVGQAVRLPELRFTFLALFIFSFGWSLLTEFITVFLIDRFQFSPRETGLYYGYTGFFYALSAGCFIYPVIRLVKLERAVYLSMFFSGAYLLLFLYIQNPYFLFVYVPFSQLFLAFVYPAISAVISNRVTEEKQGEVMGHYQAVIALALALTPFCSGLFVGNYPVLVIIVSALLMILAAAVSVGFRDRIPTFDMD